MNRFPCTNKRWRAILGLLLCCGTAVAAQAQTVAAASNPQQVDRVVAIVDERIILQSDIENQYRYLRSRGQKDDGTLRCRIFQQALANKMLLAKAILDSIEVTSEQVTEDVERRVTSMTQQFGSAAEMEKRYGKTVPEIKAEMRDIVREDLLVSRQRQQIMDGISATPREVQEFFNRIPKDSLPFFPAEVEISHIVIQPKANDAARDAARKKLEDIRAQILGNEITFEQAARFYGMDGTKERDGDLGEFGRGMMAPEFEEMVYSLREQEVSPVFETEFGFHIARLDGRSGENVRARHILIIPQVTAADEAAAKAKLNEIRELVLKDSLTFAAAAAKYSADRRTKDSGGMISNNGEFRIPIDQLDADMYFKIDPLKEGDISEPVELVQQGSPTKSYHIILLRKRYPPHVANLKDDYQKFYQATVDSKTAAEMDRWFQVAKQQVYVEIKPNECSQALSNWQ